MTLAEALHSVLLALALKSLIGSSAQGLRINGELQFVHALFEFFTFDEFHSISSKQELSLEPSGLRLAHGKVAAALADADSHSLILYHRLFVISIGFSIFNGQKFKPSAEINRYVMPSTLPCTA